MIFLKVIPYPNYASWLYRGIPCNREVIPSLFYKGNITKVNAAEYERTLLKSFFERVSIANSNLKGMFIARHFGLYSRLMDLTIDISVGLHFALKYANEGAACEAWLYAFDGSSFGRILVDDVVGAEENLKERKHWVINPSLNYSDSLCKEAYRRMHIQSGKFLFQSLATAIIPLTQQLLGRWVLFKIPKYAFERISEDVRLKFGGKDISVDLLPEKNHDFDRICAEINNGCLV